MTLFFSQSTKAFYDTRIHGDRLRDSSGIWINNERCKIPTDAVEIDTETHQLMMDGISRGLELDSDEDGYPELKEIEQPVIDPWKAIRDQRAYRIDQVRWVIERHRDELSMSIPTTLSDEKYQELLEYIQKLRELPDTFETVGEIVWPTNPI